MSEQEIIIVEDIDLYAKNVEDLFRVNGFTSITRVATYIEAIRLINKVATSAWWIVDGNFPIRKDARMIPNSPNWPRLIEELRGVSGFVWKIVGYTETPEVFDEVGIPVIKKDFSIYPQALLDILQVG